MREKIVNSIDRRPKTKIPHIILNLRSPFNLLKSTRLFQTCFFLAKNATIFGFLVQMDLQLKMQSLHAIIITIMTTIEVMVVYESISNTCIPIYIQIFWPLCCWHCYVCHPLGWGEQLLLSRKTASYFNSTFDINTPKHGQGITSLDKHVFP